MPWGLPVNNHKWHGQSRIGHSLRLMYVKFKRVPGSLYMHDSYATYNIKELRGTGLNIYMYSKKRERLPRHSNKPKHT